MTTQEFHDQALAAIRERRGLSQRATAAQWEMGEVSGPFPEERIPAYCDVEPLVAGGINTPDAALIVAMRNDYDPLLTLAEDVLGRHRDGGASQGFFGNGYGTHDHCCETCGSFGEYGVAWPCADAAAALRALGVAIE